MTAVAWVFLTAFVFTASLLTIAVGGNANLVHQLRVLRRENTRLRADRAAGQAAGGVR